MKKQRPPARREPSGVVFTTTYSGDLYAFNAATGAILLKTPLPARTNAPVTIDRDYVITAGSVAQSAGQRMFIVAYRLRSHGQASQLRGLVADHRRQR
jgi:outer membrane protein assembly factor BamB